MGRHFRFLVISILIIAFFSGCDILFNTTTPTTDSTSPTISDSDQLTISSVESEGITFSWNKASDNRTSAAELEYQLYTSDQSVPDLESIESSGNSIMSWTEDISSYTVNMADIDLTNTAYFNLVVKDKADNSKAYSQTAFITDSISALESGYTIKTVPADGSENYYYYLDLTELIQGGTSDPEVYYLFTNTGNPGDRPEIGIPESSIFSFGSKGFDQESYGEPESRAMADLSDLNLPVALKDYPGLAEYEEKNLPAFTTEKSFTSRAGEWLPSGDVAGDEPSTGTFFVYEGENIPVTCRAVATDGTITLNIWVADESWDDGVNTGNFLVTETMVNEMTAKFLSTGDDNDIYDWVTGIFGDEWGDHEISNLIGDNNEITFLLYDIDSDGHNSTTEYPFSGNSYIAGYFMSTNYYTSSPSNQRVMFYMDAPVYACADDPGTEEVTETEWGITGYYQKSQLSTLAHEFQHMIHYYQKIVSRGTGQTATWINEMCSMVAEDFVADRMGVQGPRGLEWSDPVVENDYLDGEPETTGGRLPLFNYFNDGSLSTWNTPASVLIDYSLSYSFGAWLARNYGGAELFRDIVWNEYTDEESILYALENQGYSLTFEDLLVKWGTAVILSDSLIAYAGHKFNNSGPFDSSFEDSSVTYKLGAINLYKYRFKTSTTDGSIVTLDGPYYYENGTTANNVFYYHEKDSNIYYKDSGVGDGNILRQFTLAPDIRTTVIIRE